MVGDITYTPDTTHSPFVRNLQDALSAAEPTRTSGDELVPYDYPDDCGGWGENIQGTR